MRWLIAAAVLGLLGLSAVVADIPRPRPDPKPNANPQAKFFVEVDPNATEAKLVVPRKIVARKADLDVPKDGTLTMADEGEEASSPYRSMIAGVSLALAISCAGLWLVRRGKVNGKTMFAISAVGVLSGSALVWANGVPGARPKPQPPAPPANQLKVTVEYIAQGDTVKLIVPPGMANQFGAGPAAGPTGSPPPSAEKPE